MKSEACALFPATAIGATKLTVSGSFSCLLRSHFIASVPSALAVNELIQRRTTDAPCRTDFLAFEFAGFECLQQIGFGNAKFLSGLCR